MLKWSSTLTSGERIRSGSPASAQSFDRWTQPRLSVDVNERALRILEALSCCD